MNILEHNNIKINLDMKMCYIKDKEINLTKTEYDFLLYLLNNAGRLISRGELEQKVWGRKLKGRAIDVTVSRIRKKLGTNDIITRPGFGYCIK